MNGPPDEEPTEYGLVMPFVVCQDQGGPYDAQSFVCGVYYGEIDGQLIYAKPALLEQYIPTGLVKQIDLLAMHHGYTMQSEPWEDHPDEWTWIRLTKADSK